MKQNQFIKTLRYLALIAVVACFKAAAQAQEAYAVYTTDGTLTFYYDDLKSSRNGTKYALNTGHNDPGWFTDHRLDIKKAVFTSSFSGARPTSTYRWFALKFSFDEESNLSEVTGIQYLNTSAVTTMEHMFYYSEHLTSLDVSNFNTSKVTNMREMFRGCSSLTSLDVSNFNTEKVTDMGGMFFRCSALTSLDVSNFNTAKVKDMSSMFCLCSSLTSLDVSKLNTSNVTDMQLMFQYCSSLTSLDVSNFNTENVTHMQLMFQYCSSLTSLNLSNFNTENVDCMLEMFNGCSSLTSLDVSNFNTEKVTDMSDMFAGCASLTNLDVSNFNTAKVTEMSRMFFGCSALTSLDLSNFNTENVDNMLGMFNKCSSLKTIYADEAKWSTAKLTYEYNMFSDCTSLVGGNGTVYDSKHTDYMYARIDKPGQPGYLTQKNVKPVRTSDDLLDFINGLGDKKGTEDEPVEVPVDSEGLTIDNDVEVDDAQLWIDGTGKNPQTVIAFIGGAINIHQNAGMSFKAVTFADKDAAVAALLRAAGDNGGIRNSGALAFENCTFREGGYTIENSGTTTVGGVNAGCRLVNKAGGRINVTSPLTDDLTIVIPTEADVEQGVAIVTGVSSTDHIQMSLPTGYAHKYDATAGGIVVYSTTGITALEQQKTVIESYDVTGRKADKESKGLRIQRMSDGTMKKVMTNPSF